MLAIGGPRVVKTNPTHLQETVWAVGLISVPIAMGKLRLRGNRTYSEV